MSKLLVTLAQLVILATFGFAGYSSSVLANTVGVEERGIGGNVAQSPIATTQPQDLQSDLVPLSLLHESMWERLQADFEYTHLDNVRIDEQIEFLLSGLRSLRSNLIDASPYLFHIVEQLDRAGVPADIALLPLIESAFNPTAASHKSAVGIWQFIPATAKHYGLSTGKQYDQRKDVMASTGAAIRFLKDLQGMFDGDWLLAMAAYNTGPGNVRSAMRVAVEQGKDPVFWNLKLSVETSNYVPRLIAAAKIVGDPDKYGLVLPALANRKKIESVAIGRRISLRQISELTSIPIEQITALNIGLHQGLTPPNGPHTLTLPVEATQPLLKELRRLKRQPLVNKQSHLAAVSRNDSYAFVIDGDLQGTGEAIADKAYMPFKAYKYKTHVVQSGDNLWKVSQKLNVAVDALRDWNDLAGDQKSIQVGDKLRIATLGVESDAADAVKLMNYRVLPTDTLPTIADKFNLPIGIIKKWNKSLWQKDFVQSGQTLRIPAGVLQVPIPETFP